MELEPAISRSFQAHSCDDTTSCRLLCRYAVSGTVSHSGESRSTDTRIKVKKLAASKPEVADSERATTEVSAVTTSIAEVAVIPEPVQPVGNKETWMAQAGIPQSDWWAVDSIVQREAGWNPCAYNPSQSDCNAQPTSACGLAQALPCSKVGANWSDPVVSLKWQYQYVTERYGGYAQAVAFWNVNHWY